MCRNSYFSASGSPATIMTTPFPIRGGYCGNRTTYPVLIWQFLSRNPPYFYFRSAWSNFLKNVTRVTLSKWIPSTKFEADPTIHYRDMTPLPPIRYVTLWPWRLTFRPWMVVGNFSSNPPPTLSILRPSFLELRCLYSTIGNTNSLLAIAHAQYHVTYL